MPKKSRRAKAKRHARAATMPQRRAQEHEPVTAKPRLSAKIYPDTQHTTTPYQYLMPEIKRIAILAGSIILTIIILSFVLG